MRFLGIFALAALTALPVAAQDLQFDPSHTMACIQATPDYNQAGRCLGLSAEHCMRDTPGGFSTAGESACLSAEAAYWDDRLNAVYQELRAQDQAQDAEFLDPDYPGLSQAETLRDMQRGWIAYRDGTCRYEAAQWTGGTGAGPAHAACLMRLTAFQTLYLQRQLGM